MRILRGLAELLVELARLPWACAKAARAWWRCGATVAQRNRRFRAASTLAGRPERGIADRLSDHARRCVWFYGLSGGEFWDLLDVAAKTIAAGADEAAVKHEMRLAAELWAAMNDVQEEPEHAKG